MLIALSLPLTFSMSGEQALVLLVSMYVGSVSGGLITATLLRIPGTPASIMTTLDGYPMAQRGEAGRALGLGIGASFIGGMIAWVFLISLAAPMAQLSLKFGPFEFFSLVMVAMVLIATVGGRSAVLGLFAGFLGILAAMPGASPATGVARWTFGVHELDDGLKLLPVLIGLFAVNQVIAELLRLNETIERVPAASGRLLLKFATWKRHMANLIRSSLIGTWVGILPGIGANIGSVMAYSAAKSASKKPEAFGSGSEEGIVAAESANNATVGGALIPLVAMGIPGSVIDAILLGALGDSRAATRTTADAAESIGSAYDHGDSAAGQRVHLRLDAGFDTMDRQADSGAAVAVVAGDPDVLCRRFLCSGKPDV